ncbi:hypothetical protein ES703_123783 [subsurface metagenome]
MLLLFSRVVEIMRHCDVTGSLALNSDLAQKFWAKSFGPVEPGMFSTGLAQN